MSGGVAGMERTSAEQQRQHEAGLQACVKALGCEVEALKQRVEQLEQCIEKAAPSAEMEGWMCAVLKLAQGTDDVPLCGAPLVKARKGMPADEIDSRTPKRDWGLGIFEQFLPYRQFLTAEQWEAICLRYREGLTIGEIAQVLGICRGAVSNRVRRAWRIKTRVERERRGQLIDIFRKLSSCAR